LSANRSPARDGGDGSSRVPGKEANRCRRHGENRVDRTKRRILVGESASGCRAGARHPRVLRVWRHGRRVDGELGAGGGWRQIRADVSKLRRPHARQNRGEFAQHPNPTTRFSQRRKMQFYKAARCLVIYPQNKWAPALSAKHGTGLTPRAFPLSNSFGIPTFRQAARDAVRGWRRGTAAIHLLAKIHGDARGDTAVQCRKEGRGQQSLIETPAVRCSVLAVSSACIQLSTCRVRMLNSFCVVIVGV